jgi:hypothetical protein
MLNATLIDVCTKTNLFFVEIHEEKAKSGMSLSGKKSETMSRN